MPPCCEPTTSTPGNDYYSAAELELMQTFSDRLNEQQRRLFLGLEATRLGPGGRQYLVEAFSTSFSVIRQGERELRDPERLPEPCRVRHPGGGRRRIEDRQPEILDALEEIMDTHIAGDPMNPEVRWTDLSLVQIRDTLVARGFDIGVNTTRRLVKKNSRSRNRSRKPR